MHLIDLSTLLLLPVLALSVLDGLWLHLWVYRLPERPESRREHALHSLRALLFLPFLGLYLVQPGGWLLYGLCALLLLDLGVAGVDVLSEKASRASLGGLPAGEYLLHLTIVFFHTAALTLALVALPLQAWSPQAAPVAPVASEFAGWIARLALPGTLLTIALHVWLIYEPGLISRLERRAIS